MSQGKLAGIFKVSEPYLILLVVILQIGQVIFFQRDKFFRKYDIDYWKDRFEHSQYVLPLSERIIGDDGLYAYAGYRLIKGDDPFSINVDKPPLGKYILGFSIVTFGNPYIITLLVGLGSLAVIYVIALLLFKSKRTAALSVALFSLDALFFTQMWTSALDLIQLFFLLLYFVFLLKWTESRRSNLWLFFAGLALGFFSETKPPILLPILIFTGVILIFRKSGRILPTIWPSIISVTGFSLGIFLPYVPYVRLNHTLLDIAKIHKFMLVFYMQSHTATKFGAIFQSFIMGRFPEINTNRMIQVNEWWILWPIIFIGCLWAGYKLLFVRQNKNFPAMAILFYCLSAFITFMLIPAYTRYLLLILPFMYFIFIQTATGSLPSVLKPVIALTLIIGLANTYVYLHSPPGELINNYLYTYSHLYFQDVYQESVDSSTKKLYTRQQFNTISRTVVENAQIGHISTKLYGQSVSRFGQSGTVNIAVTYYTQSLGHFTENKTLDLTKENGQWKIRWNWDLLLSQFMPEYRIRSDITIGRRGAIYDTLGNTTASDRQSYLVSVDPSLMETNREPEMMSFLSEISLVPRLDLQNQYLENPLPKSPVKLFSLMIPVTPQLLHKLKSYPGIVLTPHVSRIYPDVDAIKGIQNAEFDECCTRIYSSYNYHGVSGQEVNYEQKVAGWDGGTLNIFDKNGKLIRTIISKEPHNGQDVTVTK